MNLHEAYTGKNLMLLNEEDCFGLTIDMHESNLKNGLLKFKGKFQEAEAVNKNKRLYPFTVLDENVKRLHDIVKSRGLIGELDHPTDSIIHFKEASHVITRLWWEGQILMGEGEILNTAHGKQLKELLNGGVRVGISSRGVGNGKVDEAGILVIGESYKLITFDAVADPSTFEAFQEKVTGEGTVSVSVPRDIFNNSANNTEKNNNSGIYKLTKESVIAAFSGLVKEQTNKIREGLR